MGTRTECVVRLLDVTVCMYRFAYHYLPLRVKAYLSLGQGHHEDSVMAKTIAMHMLQAIIMHKWHSHARRRLLLDMGLYLLLMVLFIADLCLVGLALGRSPLEETLASDENGSNPSISTHGFAMARIEVMMLILCIRDMWYGLT